MRRLALARGSFIVLVTLAFVSTLTLAVATVASPSTDAGRSFSFAQRGDDYAIAWVPLVPMDHVVEAHWSLAVGNRSPERLMIVPAEDLADVFAGRAPAHVLAEAKPSTFANWSSSWTPEQGYLRLRFLHEDPPLVGPMTWEFQCDACHDDPRPAVVWTRGASWAGAPVQHGAWSVDAGGRATGDAPILVRAVSNEHNFVETYDLMMGAVLTLGALAIASGAWWAIETRRDRLARRAEAPSPPNTEELLRLVAYAERYVEGIARWALVGGVAILVVVAALVATVVPALLEASRRHSLGSGPDDAAPILVLMVPFFGAAALALWLAAFGRLRRERDRWRAVSKDMTEATRRILE